MEALGDDRLGRGSGERRLAGQHLVEHGAERVHIGPSIERAVTHRLFRAHVGWGPYAHSRLGEPVVAPPECPRDPEVSHERAPIFRQEQVLGFNVTVNNPVLVGILECPGSIRGDPERDING